MKFEHKFSLRKARSEWNRNNLLRLVTYIIAAFLINLALEMFSRRSFYDGIHYLITRPWQFFYDTLIILFSLSFSMLFRKRNFCFLLLSAVWLGLGIANCILLGFRATPLTAPDIWLLASVRDIIEVYLNHFELIALMLAISLLIGVIILLWIRSRKYHPSYYFAVVHIALFGAILSVVTLVFLKNGTIASQFPNLPDAYDANGFAYCFSVSAITQGISKPEGYTQETIQEILSEQSDLPSSMRNTPNLVFVQLESFFDANYLKNLSFDENPVPNFEKLKASCSTGLFYVPSIGAGTANTEFEVLSGMNLDHFGVGEYPYKTVVKHRTCESIAYALKDLGYATHAIHNNNATFYSRDRVYANFGFDSFTSLEYMHDVEHNPLSWAKDTVLTEEILKALKSTTGKDLVFTVSVQPHGKYPTEPIEGAKTISVYGMEDEARKNGFEYYLHELKETDAFIGELIDAISAYSEPTIVVFYGDHLPSFGITQEELSTGTVQSTEYVIWANYAIKKVDRDVQAYQLASLAFERAGIHEGTLIRYHQAHTNTSEADELYQNALRLLEYDILFGDHWYIDGAASREPVQMRFGVDEIKLTGISYDETLSTLNLSGMNFTPFSIVAINDEQAMTEFVDRETLRVSDVSLEPGDVITVLQVSATDSLRTLSQTDPYLYDPTGRIQKK